MGTVEAVIAELARIYEDAVATLRSDIANFAESGSPPPPERRIARDWCYPELRIHYAGQEKRPDVSRAFGRLSRPGIYACSITRPAM